MRRRGAIPSDRVTRVRIRVATGVLLLAGCSGQQAGPGPAPEPATVDSAAATPEAVPLTFVGPSSPGVQDLWRPVGSLPRLASVLPDRLDFAEIRASPELSDAPIDAAVLAVGSQPASFGVGEVAVMSTSGEWRLVDRERLGMRDPDIVEQQFSLSPDGSTLAMGDELGIVFVRLSTGASTRVETRVADPVLHLWTDDGGVVFSTRGAQSPATWKARPEDRSVARVDFHAWNAAADTEGRIAELVPRASEPRSRQSFTGIRMWSGGDVRETVPLGVGIPQVARVGQEWSSLLGVVQLPSNRAGGVAALEGGSGRLAGFLQLPRALVDWTTVEGVVDERWLLLSLPFGEGGGLVAWDPYAEELRSVTRFDEQAVVVRLATGQLG